MSLPQTSINAAGMQRGMAGDLADSGDSDVLSSFSSESSTQIPFGVGVKPDGTYGGVGGVLLPTASSSKIKGIVVRDLNHVAGGSGVGDLGTTGLLPKAGFGVIRTGRVIAQVDAGVSSITAFVDRAFCRFESDGGSNTVIGRWRNTDDGHVVDTSAQAVFASDVFTLPDGTKGALVDCNFTNKP